MSNEACPLNFTRVDENISRVNALFVSSFVILYLYMPFVYILIFLVFDFSIKLFFQTLTSPLSFISQGFKKLFYIKDAFVDGGAKRLAGFFGLFFMSLLLVIHFFHSWTASFVVALLYLSCSFLDILFSFCIGCKIYFIIKKIYPNFMQ
jgi:hypothetical protein